MMDEPMFPAPRAPELKLSRALAKYKLAEGEKVSYAKYRTTGTRVQCQECVCVLHEASGKGWSISGATQARKTESGERMLLCGGHAQLWKKLDGVSTTRKCTPRGRR